MCSFFVVPGNRQPLLGMPDIKTLGILTINFNTVETKEANGHENCQTRQEMDTTENTIQIQMVQNLKLKIHQWSMIIIAIA